MHLDISGFDIFNCICPTQLHLRSEAINRQFGKCNEPNAINLQLWMFFWAGLHHFYPFLANVGLGYMDRNDGNGGWKWLYPNPTFTWISGNDGNGCYWKCLADAGLGYNMVQPRMAGLAGKNDPPALKSSTHRFRPGH